MKIAVTGASGFIGSHLCQQLVHRGHKVLSLARNRKKIEEFSIPGEFIAFDLENPEAGVAKLPEDLEGMVHLAAVLFGKKESDFMLANVEGLEKLLQPLVKKYGQSSFHLILVSSIAAAGPGQLTPINENDSPNPISAYGRSKLLGEQLVQKLLPENWQLTIIRPPMVIGPRDPALSEVFALINKGMAFYPGGFNAKKKKFSFVSVYDLVNAMACCLEVKLENRINTFFICYPHTPTLEKIHESIARALNKRIHISLPIPLWSLRTIATICDTFNINSSLTRDKVREMGGPSWEFDSKLSQQQLGFTYQVELDAITKETAQDYRQRRWL